MRLVFLLDFDNTLADNDTARDQLWRDTERVLGVERSKVFWETYEAVRHERGYVDFLATLARFHEANRDVPDELDRTVLDLPYDTFRYPDALAVIDALWRRGTPVVLSDGDPTFQPLKVARSGVTAAVRGNVLVFAHKEDHLADVARIYPAEHYVAVDDKAEVLARVKTRWGGRVSTVHVLQGKYSDDQYDGPRPDVTIRAIGDVRGLVGTDAALRALVQDASIGSGGGGSGLPASD